MATTARGGGALRGGRGQQVAPGAHLPDTLELQGAIKRCKGRVPFPEGETLDRRLTEAGSCVHLKGACGRVSDLTLLDALAKDVEKAGYEKAGDALGLHRSRKHMQIWGDALSGSAVFATLITHVLGLFDLTLVDCWANLYRHGDDMKSWHHDNYQDRSPRPTVTIGVSFGQARELAFQHAISKEEYRVVQENGDIFAFDEPFNNIFKHGVPAAPPGTAPGRRLSVILWANEQPSVPRVLRVKNPGMRDVVPLEVDWAAWPTFGKGELCREARRQRREPAPSLEASVNALKEEPASSPTPSYSSREARTTPAASEPSPDDVRRLHELFVRVARPAPSLAFSPAGVGRGVAQPSTAGTLRRPHQIAEAHSFYGGSAASRPPRSEEIVSQLPAEEAWRAAEDEKRRAPQLAEEPQRAATHYGGSTPSRPPWSDDTANRRPAEGPREDSGRFAEITPRPQWAREDAEVLAVSNALTLQGGQQVLAVLRGIKLIENRAWRIPVGWHAIHSGAQPINEERAQRVREAWPDAPPEERTPHSAIVGLFYVHSHRKPEQCRPGYIWARGPVCHVVSKTVEFPQPIRSRGGKGLWQLEAWQIAQIQQQLQGEVPINYFDLSPALG